MDNMYVDEYGSVISERDYPQDGLVLPPCTKFHVTKRNKYLRLNMAMDIETTRKDKVSAPYIITTSLQLPGTNQFRIYHTRNWKDTQDLYDKIADHYNLYIGKSKSVSMICFVHNLSYEFAFMRMEMNWNDKGFFSKDETKAIKAQLANGIEFRDTLALSDCSLVKLSKMFTLHKKKKDLDYNKMRNTLTPLTHSERRYINEDVIILNEFEDVFFENFCQYEKNPPLTNTSRLQMMVNDAAESENYSLSFVNSIQPSIDEIKEWAKYLFRGGFVHGNIRYIDREQKCKMRDITSSYPYSMLTKYVPMSKFVETTLNKYEWDYGDEPDDFNNLIDNKCVIMKVSYTDLQAKTDHSYESSSKLLKWIPYNDSVDGLDNGRIRRADYVELIQNELDYKMYQMLYTWSDMKIEYIKVAKRGMLPEFLQKLVAKEYKKKNDLKLQGLSDTIEYIMAKINVNTFYGLCCKAIYANSIKYDSATNDWRKEEQTDDQIYGDLVKRYLCYNWGIWIAAQSRFKLVDMICKVEQAGGHVVYYDTDSIKYIPSEETEQVFENENKRIAAERETISDLLKDDCFRGVNKKGVVELGLGLGEWDAEENGVLVTFKTLGAKRYMYYNPTLTHVKDEDGNKVPVVDDRQRYILKVAGLPKMDYTKLPPNPFTWFTKDGFEFDHDATDKNSVFYAKDQKDLNQDVTITDEYGNTETIHVKSYATIYPVSFKISSETLAIVINQRLVYKAERRAV